VQLRTIHIIDIMKLYAPDPTLTC